MSYTTRKKIKTIFPILNCNVSYTNFLGTQQYLRGFIYIKEKVVQVSFFQNKFCKAVFIFRFFMNSQRQNATDITVTYVTNFSVESV